MKKICAGLLLLMSCSSLAAYTLKTDFLRVAQTFENAQFPLEITGYLDLTFRVVIDEETDNGVMAHIERRMDGGLVSSYSGFFKTNEKVSVQFPDGNMGPTLAFETTPKTEEIPQGTDALALKNVNDV